MCIYIYIYILRALPGAAGPPFWTPWLAERRSCIHLRLEHSAVAVVIFFFSFSSPDCFSVYFFGSAFCLVSVTHGSNAFAASVALVLILLRMMFCFLSDDVFLHIIVFFCFVDGMMASARLCCTSSSSDLRCSCRSRICHNRFTMLRSWSYGFPLKNLQRDG